uniref:Conserved plasma membrane protein n=1 Tax=Toxocara canis TaxID=6265 RepID=A0A183USL0_TOXCA
LCGGCAFLGALCLLILEQFAPLRHYAVYIYLGVFALVIMSLVFALKTERELLLIPYIAFSIANVFLCIVTAFFAIWALSSSESSPSKYLSSLMYDERLNTSHRLYIENQDVPYVHQKGSKIILFLTSSILLASCSLVISIASVPVFLFSARVVCRCYNYFEAYHDALKMNKANEVGRV